MGLRDELIKEALEKKPYLDKITKTKVKSSAYRATEYKVPDDETRDVKEDVVLKECKELLSKMKGIWYTRIEAPVKIVGKGTVVASPSAGLPDLLLCVSGRLWAVELKRSKGGHLSGAQASKLLGVANAGGRAIVCRSAAGLLRALRGEQPAGTIHTAGGSIDYY